eukprot:9382575-Ditylum_brightwellii.AAC.1
MVTLEHSVRAANDPPFKQIQQIARYNYRKFIDKPTLIHGMMKKLPSMMHLYSKKVPDKDATCQSVERVRRAIPEAQRVTKRSEDVEKSRYLHQD